jgi:hypothetical protein
VEAGVLGHPQCPDAIGAPEIARGSLAHWLNPFAEKNNHESAFRARLRQLAAGRNGAKMLGYPLGYQNAKNG